MVTLLVALFVYTCCYDIATFISEKSLLTVFYPIIAYCHLHDHVQASENDICQGECLVKRGRHILLQAS